jgi:hypothetical protein
MSARKWLPQQALKRREQWTDDAYACQCLEPLKTTRAMMRPHPPRRRQRANPPGLQEANLDRNLKQRREANDDGKVEEVMEPFAHEVKAMECGEAIDEWVECVVARAQLDMFRRQTQSR